MAVVSCSNANREGKQVATITEWLASLGLPEYAQRFVENGIDVSVLRYLTDQDLEKIGALLGHRRKMLAAIADSPLACPGDLHLPATVRGAVDRLAQRHDVGAWTARSVSRPNNGCTTSPRM